MKYVLIVLFAFASSVQADDAWLKRVVALEKRIAALETQLAPVLEQERVKHVAAQQKERARERMMMDGEIYSRADLNIIEKLYQTANQDWRSEDAKKSLKLLADRYPRANRTGCAVLYLGQMSEGDEQLDYLKQAIARHSGCYYGNGVQVGGYARLYLAMRHKKEGQDQRAGKLFEEIRTHFPDAIDHKGQLLTSHLAGLE